jgi:alkanesulfonate monooxygenase SsuD/methylene tetrahydromethanopterin reductase-like flavin-dependent oxidoreductase (luciferase family)
VLRERVLAMKEIWTRDEAEFHGEFVRFDRLWSYPKPVQRPHPPILLGVNTPAARQRVVEYCDGWLPIPGRAGDLGAAIADLRRRAERAGRDPGAVPVSVYGGTPDAAALDGYARAGAERVVFALPSAGREILLPRLDRLAGLAGAFG